MDDFHAVEQGIAAAWPASSWADVTTIVGVSGGPDSVALLRALVRLFQHGAQRPQGRLVVAHFHHRLRSAEADQDANFVAQLCAQLGIAFFQGRASQPARAGGDGLEAEARTQRYAFFRQLADQLGARYLAMGHTANDQSETILQRIVRGTGIRGLAGIPPFRPLSELTTVVRPMLKLQRRDILAYLDTIGQPYRVDSTNQHSIFTRNRLRHQLLPQLAAEYNPGIVDALLRLGRQAAEVMTVLDQFTDPLWDRCVTSCSADTVQITRDPLADQPAYLLQHLLVRIWRTNQWPLRDMGEPHWQQLARFVQIPSRGTGSFSLPGPVHVQQLDDVIQLQWGGGASTKSS